MLKLSIIGQDTLAVATLHCCSLHFNVSNKVEVDSDIIWICYDTPIGINDEPDVNWVFEQIKKDIGSIKHNPLILISSQLPVGSICKLESLYPVYTFAYSPENIRVATGIQDFQNQARVVVGIRTNRYNDILNELFRPFTAKLIITDPETSEVVKHTLNCYLGLCIAFINEISKVCKTVGANVDIITESLKSEPRVSPKAPLRAGLPFGGGHLARDIFILNDIAKSNGIELPIISNIKKSNEL